MLARLPYEEVLTRTYQLTADGKKYSAIDYCVQYVDASIHAKYVSNIEHLLINMNTERVPEHLTTFLIVLLSNYIQEPWIREQLSYRLIFDKLLHGLRIQPFMCN